MIGVVFVEFHVDNVGIKTLISFKICYSKWNFFYTKFLVHAFPQNFLNYILYIYCDDFKPCLFNFLFSLNSHNTKMLCTICLLMAKVCNYQCRFFFFSLLLDYFLFFLFFLVMNDEHVYLASHKNSDRSCLHMHTLWNSFQS